MIITKTPKRDAIIVAGGFNAKTGSGWERDEFKGNIGKYQKGILNSSGTKLLETCKKHNLIITNTLFQHKRSHRTTWTAPFRDFTTRNGEERRNPVRNQIDYIIIRDEHRCFVTNSRSYSGINTDTDHHLVKMEINFEWHKIKSKKTTPKKSTSKPLQTKLNKPNINLK